MAYKRADANDLLQDIAHRREFLQLRPQSIGTELKDISPISMLRNILSENSSPAAFGGDHLSFHSYQLFVQNFMNPNTPYTRLLLNHGTGMGKTISAIGIALKFIDYYRRMELEEVESDIVTDHPVEGSVFVIGFAETVFHNDLMKFPELKFISLDERIQLNELRAQVFRTGSRQTAERIKDLEMKIKRRFNNRQNNGFFRFIGYRAFFNRLFIPSHEFRNEMGKFTEAEIYKLIKEEKIIVNKALLDQMNNSLIICDEVHKIYNTVDKNNWGVAIQYVLDNVPTVRGLFLSATPINNSPSEVIDLMNLLLPPSQKLAREDYFKTNGQPKPGAIEHIGQLSRGRVSFVVSTSAMFPTRHLTGEDIAGIPFLKFVRCPMTALQYETYKHIDTKTLSIDAQHIIDIIIPNPDQKSKFGLYKTQEIRSIMTAPQQWKSKNHIDFVHDRLVGAIFERSSLEKYSNKYAIMYDTIIDNLKNGRGKMFIFHMAVYISGILLIEEILKQNGFLDEWAAPTSKTICICGQTLAHHSKRGSGADEPSSSDLQQFKVDDEVLFSYKECATTDPCVVKIRIVDMAYPFIHNDPVKRAAAFEWLKQRKVMIESIIEPDIDKMYTENGFWTMPAEMSPPDEFDVKIKQQKITYYINFESPARDKQNKHVGGARFHKKQNIRRSASGRCEHFIPARFVVVHGELNQTQVLHSIDKFNHPDNTNGEYAILLLGARKMQESYNLKAVREVLIMSRPDNIPALKQVFGRAIRNKSHELLPKDKRTVNIRIFTSRIPGSARTLSYDEQRYKDKMDQYILIQKIEKELHQYAVDAPINRNIIWSKNQPNKTTFDMMWYPATINAASLQRTELIKSSTFDTFYSNSTIHMLIQLIKHLFLEYSSIWTYDDLWFAVIHPPHKTEIDTSILLDKKELFDAALKSIIYESGLVPKHKESLYIEGILDPEDRVLQTAARFGHERVIVQLGEYYMLVPLVDNVPTPDYDMFYRSTASTKKNHVNINAFLDTYKSVSSYDDQKERFMSKWERVSINNMEIAVCDFGIDFHERFMEECIEYMFSIWTRPNTKKSPMHNFMIKMIVYYGIRNLILWVATIEPRVYEKYKKYTTEVNLKLKNKKKNDEIENLIKKHKYIQSSGIVNLLKSTINQNVIKWIPDEARLQYQRFLEATSALFNMSETSRKKLKAPADLLPIGHTIKNVARFWFLNDKPEWTTDINYTLETAKVTENSIVIGYDEKPRLGLIVHFKLRSPIQKIKKHKDVRLLERGTVAISKSKDYLINIAKKLEIEGDIDNMPSIKLAEEIRARLIYNELRERIMRTNIRWFYFYYEKRPKIKA